MEAIAKLCVSIDLLCQCCTSILDLLWHLFYSNVTFSHSHNLFLWRCSNITFGAQPFHAHITRIDVTTHTTCLVKWSHIHIQRHSSLVKPFTQTLPTRIGWQISWELILKQKIVFQPILGRDKICIPNYFVHPLLLHNWPCSHPITWTLWTTLINLK